ncbi:hypothetical protein BRD56_03065 [Thermoplasmatales archaeon SW_10_69_26]|nr:MAG: hypothetical protein BRD56_03065 [Thermoplasmatales archaeon SW_10_69_26]
MHVHRSVGQVTFVTCDMVLGAPDTISSVTDLIDRMDPDTIALDLTVDDMTSLESDEVEDPFLAAHVADMEEEAEEPPLTVYQRIVNWAEDNDADLHPIGSRSSVGLSKARRIKRTVKRAEGANVEDRARAGVDALLDDAQVGPLTKRRQTSLVESLVSLLRREPPRTMAFFTFPWGEMVSADVRRELGLRRMEGEKMAGGWPD